MQLGNTHGGTAVDSQGHVYFNTDAKHAIVVCDAKGAVVRTMGADLAGGLHGITVVQEGDEEFLYCCHTGHHAIYKLTLEGEVVWQIGYPEESGKYEKAAQYKPTGIAVAPDGSIYVADGYGQNWVHQYSKDREYVRSFGGRGKEAGQFVTCHGILVDTRSDAPSLLVADRENHRLQRFSMNGEHLAVIEPGLRRPCHLYEHDGDLVIADLAGRITLLDEKDELIAHLGDNPEPARRANNGVPTEEWADGHFLAPHSAAWDAAGNLYVQDWNRNGRMTKLRRIPVDTK